MNKSQKIAALVFGLGVATSVSATDFTDTAPVTSSTPNYREVSYPRQECWVEEVPVQVPQGRSLMGVLVGGIAGGIIGNQVGGGSGKEAATGLGAAIGAITGDRLSNDNASQQPAYTMQRLQRCQNVSETRQVVSGYTVHYRYAGRDVEVVLPYDPGNSVTLGVGVLRGR